MAYWLLKSEPHKYSWDDMVRDKRTGWDGVRNNTAALNLKAMKAGDRAFFYHSQEGKEAVGIVEIVREAYPDPSDPTGRFVMVDVAPVEPLNKSVTLAAIKAEPSLKELDLVRQSRLSVGRVSDAHWRKIMAMAGMKA